MYDVRPENLTALVHDVGDRFRTVSEYEMGRSS